MAEKKFEECGGLALTDEIKLCVAEATPASC